MQYVSYVSKMALTEIVTVRYRTVTRTQLVNVNRGYLDTRNYYCHCYKHCCYTDSDIARPLELPCNRDISHIALITFQKRAYRGYFGRPM